MRAFRSAAVIAAILAAPFGGATAQQRSAADFEFVAPEPVQQEILIPPVLEADDLAHLMTISDPYIVDIRNAQTDAALYSYAAGHIPGSVNMPYGRWRGLWNDPLAVPTDAALTDLIQSTGLTRDRPIVLVHSSASQGNFGSAAFVYWTLKSSGFENMAILNGGVTNWQNSGYELSTVVEPITRSGTIATLQDDWLATHEDVDAVLDGTSTAQLLDARPLHQIAEVASLEGSHSLNAIDLVAGEGATAASDESIFMRIKQADLDWEFNDVITYCNNGALAAVDWFMASEIAEIPNVRLYAHSLNARQRAQSALNGLFGN